MNSHTLSNDEKEKSKEKYSYGIFGNLKSDFFLRKLFDILYKKKSFEIIRYNKRIQQRLNITINDYKELQLIEIEIIPVKNGEGQFINRKIKNGIYYHDYHIYFNGIKEEIKRNYITKFDNVTKINIVIDPIIYSFNKLFWDCDCIESISFKKMYRTNIKDMSYMFSRSTSLKEINFLSNNKATNTNGLFEGCSSLKEIKLSNLNFNKAVNINGDFEGCSSLKEMKLTNLNINNIINMHDMFKGCSALKEIIISNLNTQIMS